MANNVYSDLLLALRNYQTKADLAIKDVDRQADFNTNRVTGELASIINSLAGWDADTNPNDAIANLNTVLEWTRTAITNGSLNAATDQANGLMTPAHVKELEAVRVAVDAIYQKTNTDDKSTYIVDERNIDSAFNASSTYYSSKEIINGEKVGHIVDEGQQLVPFWVCGLDKFVHLSLYPNAGFSIMQIGDDFRSELIAADHYPPELAKLDFDNKIRNALKIKINLTYPISDVKFLVSASFSYRGVTSGVIENRSLAFVFDVSDTSVEFSEYYLDTFECHSGVFVTDVPGMVKLKHGRSTDGSFETYQVLNTENPKVFEVIYDLSAYVSEDDEKDLKTLSKGVVSKIGSYIHDMSRTCSGIGYYSTYQITKPFITGENPLIQNGARLAIGYSDFAWLVGDSEITNKTWFTKINIIRKPTVSYIEEKLTELNNLINVNKNIDNVSRITLADLTLEGKTAYTNVDAALTSTAYLDKAIIEGLVASMPEKVSRDLSVLNLDIVWTGNDVNLALVIGNDLPSTLKEITINKPSGTHCNLALMSKSDTQLISGENRMLGEDIDKHLNVSVKILNTGILSRDSLFGVDNSVVEEQSIDSSLITRWKGTDSVISSEYFAQERQDYILSLEGGVLIRLNNISLNEDKLHIGEVGLKLVETVILNSVQYSALFDLDTATLSVKKRDLITDAPETDALIKALYSFKATAPSVDTTLMVANTESVFSKTKSIKFIDDEGKPVVSDVTPEETVVTIPKLKVYNSPTTEHYLLEELGQTDPMNPLVPVFSPDGTVVSLDTAGTPSGNLGSLKLANDFEGNFSLEFAIDAGASGGEINGVLYLDIPESVVGRIMVAIDGQVFVMSDDKMNPYGSPYWTDITRYEHLILSVEWVSPSDILISVERLDGRFFTQAVKVFSDSPKKRITKVISMFGVL